MRFWHIEKGFVRSVFFSRTFCLLSSLGTCRTNKPSLSELTEIPAGGESLFCEERAPNAAPSWRIQTKGEGRPLTFQGFVINALLEFGLLYDDGAVGEEQQLAGPRLVALPVVLGDGHGVLKAQPRRLKHQTQTPEGSSDCCH